MPSELAQMPWQHRALAAFAFLALTSLLAPDQIQNDAAYTPVASGRMQPGTRVRGRFRKPSDVPVNTQQEANAGDIVLACSELATLAGENPFKDAADGWRRVIRNNFKPTYKKLVGQAPEMLSREELASQELQRLPIAEKMKLQQFQETAVKKNKERGCQRRGKEGSSANIGESSRACSIENQQATRWHQREERASARGEFSKC